MKIASLLLFLAAGSFAAPPQRTSLNGSWLFSIKPGPDNARWTAVTLPHTAQSQSTAWYQRSIDVPQAAVDKHVRIVFDAVSERAKLWLNGVVVGVHDGGYGPFEIDLTPSLKTGATNLLALEMEKPGILRSAHLLTTGRVFPMKQTVVATPQRISVSVMVRNTLDNTSGVQASFEVRKGGKIVGRSSVNATVPPNLTQSIDAAITLPPADVKLWDPDHPNLYQLRTVIAKNAEAVESAYDTEIESTFGIRTVEIRGTQFLLNGEPLRLGGANSVAEPSEQDLRSMKELGMVFLDIAHPVSATVLDWADRNGMLLIAPSEMRDRHSNHPSVIAWKVITRDDYTFTRRMDPTRPITSAAEESGAYADFLSATMETLEATHTRWPQKPVFVREIRQSQGLARKLAQHPYVMGAAAATPGDPKWGDEFRTAVIRTIFQRNGNTFVEVQNPAGFPSQILRDYEVRVGPLTRRLPAMNPGDIWTLEFEHVNPYTVAVWQPTDFVVDSR
jgi:beta-glucuronidase